MSPENFTYWLQGFFEISESKMLSSKQVQIIKDHLDLVFNKVTPDRKEDSSVLKNGPAIITELPGTIECEKNWSEVISKSIEHSLKIQKDSENPANLCETAQRFGLGKFNIKKTTVYC